MVRLLLTVICIIFYDSAECADTVLNPPMNRNDHLEITTEQVIATIIGLFVVITGMGGGVWYFLTKVLKADITNLSLKLDVWNTNGMSMNTMSKDFQTTINSKIEQLTKINSSMESLKEKMNSHDIATGPRIEKIDLILREMDSIKSIMIESSKRDEIFREQHVIIVGQLRVVVDFIEKLRGDEKDKEAIRVLIQNLSNEIIKNGTELSATSKGVSLVMNDVEDFKTTISDINNSLFQLANKSKGGN